MRRSKKEPVKGNPTDELRLGIASWDDGSGTSMSIKYTRCAKRGRAARGGEMPVKALSQAIKFAKHEGYL